MAKKSPKSRIPLDDATRVLVLHGNEPFLITDAVNRLKTAVEEKHGEVEIIRFDGSRTDAATVLDEARSFGLLQQYKIIVVDKADEFLKEQTGHRPILERYCKSPADNATIVLRCEKWIPGRLGKAINQVGGAIKCEVVDRGVAVNFCIEKAKSEHRSTIERATAERLVQRVGTSLGRLNSELARLAVMADPVDGITARLIDEQVPLSREEQAWAIQSALMQSKPADAMATVFELMEVSRQSSVLMAYCYSDLARKLYAAARMRENSRNEADIDAYFGKWNPIRFAVKDESARGPSDEFAALMQDSINILVRTRTSLGNDRRSVDLMAARFLASRGGVGR